MNKHVDRFGNELRLGDSVSFLRPYTRQIVDGKVIGFTKTKVIMEYVKNHPSGYNVCSNNIGDTVSRKFSDVFKRPADNEVTIPKYRYDELLEESELYRETINEL